MSEGKFRLETAIEKAWDDYLTIDKETRSPAHVLLAARKFAPRNVSDCLTVLEEHKELFLMDSQAGWLLLDVILATVTNYMFRVLLQKDQEYQQKQAAEMTRNLVTRATPDVLKEVRRSKR